MQKKPQWPPRRLATLGGAVLILFSTLFGTYLGELFPLQKLDLPGGAKSTPRGNPLSIPVLGYHQIVSDARAEKGDNDYSLGVSSFEAQMEWLVANGYGSVTLDEFYAYVAEGRPPDVEKPILITFDDGWAGQYERARGVLNRLGLTAVFFIYPSVIEGHKPSGKTFMSWSQLKTLADEGHDIESHSYTHPLLNRLTYEEQTEELRASAKDVQTQMNHTMKWVAYPYGVYNLETIRAMEAAAFVGGFTVFPGENTYGANTSRLRRFLVLQKHTLQDFRGGVEQKSLPIIKFRSPPGSRLTPGQPLAFELGFTLKEGTLRLEAGNKFTEPNQKQEFKLKENTLTFLPKKQGSPYYVVHIIGQNERGEELMTSYLYFW